MLTTMAQASNTSVPSFTFGDDPSLNNASAADAIATTMMIGTYSNLHRAMTMDESSSGSSSDSASNWLGKERKEEANQMFHALLEQCGKAGGKGATTFITPSHQWIVYTLPETTSRNLHPWSTHTITNAIKTLLVPRTTSSSTAAKSDGEGNGDGSSTNQASFHRVLFCGDFSNDRAQSSSSASSSLQSALVVAACKAFTASAYTRKTTSVSSKSAIQRQIHVSFYQVAAENETTATTTTAIPISPLQEQQWQAVCQSLFWTARLVDMPPCDLTTTAYVEEIAQFVSSHPLLANVVTTTEIVGDDLREQGLGGLYSVGMAATCPPRLLMLDYNPSVSSNDANSDDTNGTVVALVGKGIVYDTGGLSLKSKDGMPGMKMDMGGSAALLGAFCAAVQMLELQKQNQNHSSNDSEGSQTLAPAPPQRLVLILCLAENAIGPTAFRNDDIITMYSGKTVEINNTDAEGRLVLADGVAYATRHVERLSLVIDMATLTGAQLVTAGRLHGAVLANTAALEQRAVQAGLASGDVVCPLLYAPEVLLSEFDSKVADMKNSVKDRSNAQSSCAGHFIEAHLDTSYVTQNRRGEWLHVDMAGPVEKEGRATAYGVAFVLALLNVPGF